jgi:hypothetical protein
MEQPTTTPPAIFITCYNYSKTSYTRPECPYPKYNTNLNKIIEQKDNNNNIEEI